METGGALSRTPWITFPVFSILILVTVSIHLSFVRDAPGINPSATGDLPLSGSQLHTPGGGHHSDIIKEVQHDGVWFRDAIWKREFGRALSRCWNVTAGSNIVEVRYLTIDTCLLHCRN